MLEPVRRYFAERALKKASKHESARDRFWSVVKDLADGKTVPDERIDQALSGMGRPDDEALLVQSVEKMTELNAKRALVAALPSLREEHRRKAAARAELERVRIAFFNDHGPKATAADAEVREVQWKISEADTVAAQIQHLERALYLSAEQHEAVRDLEGKAGHLRAKMSDLENGAAELREYLQRDLSNEERATVEAQLAKREKGVAQFQAQRDQVLAEVRDVEVAALPAVAVGAEQQAAAAGAGPTGAPGAAARRR